MHQNSFSISTKQLTPEDPTTDLLILCLQGRFNRQALLLARNLVDRKEIHWDEVERLINYETLGPLIFSSTHDQELLPAALNELLGKDYIENSLRNLLFLNELAQILDLLADAAIPVLILKGAALTQEVYGNIAVRPMEDLDILVHEDQVRLALQVITANSYRLTSPEVRAGTTIEFENELMLRKPGLIDTALELHWHLLDSPYHQHKMRMDWFWESAVPVKFEGASALMLGPEALLLHLCAHQALHHGGKWLLWLHDVAELLHHYQEELDWDLVLSQAVAFDLILSLQQILPRVAGQWQAPVPHEVLEQLAALRPSIEEVRVFNRLTSTNRPVAQRFWSDLSAMPGWHKRIRYASRNLFPSLSYMQQRYEVRWVPLLPLYYIYRWYLGALEYFENRQSHSD